MKKICPHKNQLQIGWTWDRCSYNTLDLLPMQLQRLKVENKPRPVPLSRHQEENEWFHRVLFHFARGSGILYHRHEKTEDDLGFWEEDDVQKYTPDILVVVSGFRTNRKMDAVVRGAEERAFQSLPRSARVVQNGAFAYMS